MHLDIDNLLKELTLEEKAGLCSGDGYWWTKAVKRLGIPAIMVCDGPNGLRKQDEKVTTETTEAVCYPTGAALAASFDRDLLSALGEHIGIAARAEGVHTVLGPAVNMKRSPLCGRNFEYMSEDPYLAGELSASYINGVQSQDVGVSVKHFAANNQEYFRMSTDVQVSQRALREIYLTAFEKSVKQAHPWTLMCCYNRINGTYGCENQWLLDQVLRKEWGFDGIVMTDWGAMNDRVRALKAGLELEMPSIHTYRDNQIVQAVKNGKLKADELDLHVRRLLEWIDKGISSTKSVEYSKDDQHQFALEAAEQCSVLLKNQGGLLPLKRTAKVAFIGSFAKKTRYQGGGSSHVRSYKVSNALDCVDVPFASGWKDDGQTADEALKNEAVSLAKDSDVVVIFAGLPDSYESEGYDRKHIDLPKCQNDLISEVVKVQPKTVVVLHNGSPVAMPWVDEVPSILEHYLQGEASGEAVVRLLFGDVSPSGHLAESFPLRLEDNPSYTSFPGNGKKVEYREDVYIGYRWYDTRKIKVLFPFGHGLTYSDFSLDNMKVEKKDKSYVVRAEVKNIGSRQARAVVQLYIAPELGKVDRPVHELKGFEKISLGIGETKTVEFILDDRSFSYYETAIGDWRYETGTYQIQLGFSSADLRLFSDVKLVSPPLPLVVDEALTVTDLIEHGYTDIAMQLEKMQNRTEEEDVLVGEAAQSMAYQMPVHSLQSFLPIEDGFSERICEALKRDNKKS